MKKFFIFKNVCCSFPWRQLIITTSGDVLPCCTWVGSLPMGNINDDPISKIWENKNYLEVRKGLQNNHLPRVCKNCIVSMKKRHGI
jgi:radical SAM protein with 4Fe4S-binding SPASM domain